MRQMAKAEAENAEVAGDDDGEEEEEGQAFSEGEENDDHQGNSGNED